MPSRRSLASGRGLDPNVQVTTLDNGLSVTTVALPHLHTAVCGMFVKVGSRFESPQDNGLSHFVEHMLFRGTQKYPNSLALNTAVERLGSTLQAETGRHDSLFQLALEPDNVPAGIELLGELLAKPRFAEIELERALVLEEINEDYSEDGTEINADDIARGMAFDGHPLGQRIIGPRANVKRFTTADVRRHFSKFYGAKNCSLCVAGPVEHDKIVDVAARTLAGITPGQRAELSAAPPHTPGRKFRHVRDAGSQTSVSMVFRALPELDPRYIALSALLRILDDGMSTRLHYQIADQKGLAYSVHAGIEPLADAALFEIQSATANIKVPALVKELLSLLAGLRKGKISDDELSKARVRYRFEALAAIDDASSMASWFGGTPLYYQPPAISERLAKMSAVTKDDLVEVAETVLTPDRMALAAVGTLSRARLGELKKTVEAWR